MFRGKTHTWVTNQGLLQAYSQAILVAASDQRHARGGTHC